MGKLGAIVLFNFLLALILCVRSSTFKMKEGHSWKLIDFQYPNDTIRQGLKSKAFTPDRLLITDVQAWKNKLFLSVPRYFIEVPVTLAYVNLEDPNGDKSPKLIPYPDWETNQVDRNGSKLILVERTEVDVCDRLWMVDAGVYDIIHAVRPVRPPRILVYDLKTDKLIHEFVFEGAPPSNIVVDVTKDKCDKAFAYGAYTYGIVVYDFANKDSWIWEQENLLFDRAGLALSGLGDQGYRTLYFHSPTSKRQFSVSTKVLKDKTSVDNNIQGNVSREDRGDKGNRFAFDEKTGVFLFVKNPADHAIHCWNSIKHADSVNTTGIISVEGSANKNITNGLFGLGLDKNGNLRVVSQHLLLRENPRPNNETRVVILSAPVVELIRGTVCDAA